ncbi:MAG: S-layer homology domain-containing protein, partial [Oscillospiraceae bacterium]|nr:S-layer homology domain-containing protein [Oscillospiraceae bacterium]
TPENEYVTVDFFWNTTATDTALYRGVRIARETRVGLFANPQRTNYTFIGWSTVRDDLALANEFNFDAPVTAEVTNVYAQWLADTVFTLTYVAGTNGIGEPHVVTDVRVDSNRVLLALNVTGITPQEGYRFIGWIIEGETELRQPGTIILVDGDLTIVAQWEPIPPDGRIEKRAGSRVALIGTTIGYTITITNHDTIPMTNYEVIDELDTRLVEFVEGSLRINGEESYNATHTDGVIHVTLNEIAPGETLAITFRVTVLDAAVGMTIYNTAILRHQIHGTMDASETVEVSILSIRPNPVHYAYLIGFPDGTVGPRANITRAEVATIFFRLICDEYRIEIWSQENPFSDVALERWYNNSISTMANDGFLLGIPDGTFQPSRAITRGEFATIVSRFMNVTYTGAYRFPDIDGHWAADAINAVAYVGWVLGYPDGTFRPNAPITRSEVTAIVNRIFIRNLAEVDYLLYGLISWPDNANPNSWYYLHMKEAANSNHHDMLECGFYKMWTELIPPRDWAVLHHPNSRPEDILQ